MPKVVVEVGDVIDQFMKYDAEIKRLREALAAMTDLFKATEASAQWALSEVESLRHALECVVLYWDEWKDAPDDHPTALSLEEVVDICRPHLKGEK